MIEKMKMVGIVSSVSQKDEMLDGLRNLGLLHLAEKKAPDRAAAERFEKLSRTSSFLLDYAPDKKAKTKEALPLLSDSEFEKMYQDVLTAMKDKESLNQLLASDTAELERIKAWGNFSPGELKSLREAGYDIHFYRMGKNEYQLAAENPEVRLIRLSPIDRQETVAVLGTLPPEISAAEFLLPEKGCDELEREIEDCRKKMTACEEIFRKAALYENSFQAQMIRAQNAEEYSSASETAENDSDLVWISGYLPEADLPAFREAAAAGKWAWAADDVADDDEQVPTKMRFNKVSALIQPVLNILGVLPGYREADISLWFFLFFTLFFAMIIGDGGYGVLLLAATVVLAVRTKKKKSTVIYLLFVLSIATIIWGAVTGTWFGMEKAMEVPFLRALVIPNFANYPAYFGVTAQAQQNTIMKFSFSIGAIQMALGSLISAKRKFAARNLSWVADMGWLVAIVAMYLLALYLVIGEQLPFTPIVTLIGIGFVLVVLFGGMEPGKSFGQGLKSGLANAFTVFLDTISCFGNVMSYIRLFAVGMAGLAISQSFNGLASGFTGPLIIVAAVIVIIGHALNIVMCFLSVVVHGVRLNVMEFSGQAGVEWTGIPYEPFKVSDKLKK